MFSFLFRLFRYVLILVGVLTALFVVALLLVRFALFPQWEANPHKVADFLGERMGLPVTIGGLNTDWQKWNLNLTVQDLRIYAASKERGDTSAADAQLTLSRVALQVDVWDSLLHWDVHFRHFRLEQPTLVVRRDTEGRLFAGGVLLATSAEKKEGDTDGGMLADWLLQQRMIEISDGSVEWRDDQRAAPPLLIGKLDFRGEQSLLRYRFNLSGHLVSTTGADFEAWGETETGILQRSFDRDWQGHVQLNQVDFGSLRQWIDLPVDVTHGEGNVKISATVSKRRLTLATADMALRDVIVNLATETQPEAAPLEFQEVQGRFKGQLEKSRLVFSAEELMFVEKSGLRIEPMTATLTLDGVGPVVPPQLTTLLARAPRGYVEFDRLDVSVLTGLLRKIPEPDERIKMLTALNVQGTLENGEGSWELSRNKNEPDETPVLTHYQGRATVRDASMQAYEAFPGVRGINAKVSFDERQGTVTLEGRSVVLDLPKVFPEKLSLNTVDGDVQWVRKPEGVQIQTALLRFSNADLEGELWGTWQANGSSGIADLTAQMKRVAVNSAHRYMPYVAGENARRWLRESLKSGEADHALMHLKGDLSRFPFYGGVGGSFVADAHTTRVKMEYAPKWPTIERLEADLRFENERMTIEAKQGWVFDAVLGKTKAVIADLGAHSPLLRVEGSADAPTVTFLRFVDESPVGGWLDHMLSGTQATGDGALKLKLDIPLNGEGESKVSGSVALVDNRLDIPGVPTLTQVHGSVAFTENDVKADALSFVTPEGATGTVTLASQSGGITLTGAGTADLSLLRTHIDAQPLLENLSGTIPWQLTLHIKSGQKGVRWELTTPLTGATVELPEPFSKGAGIDAPLRIIHDTLTVAGNREEHWRIEYQLPFRTLAVVAKRVRDGSSWRLDRALINFSETKKIEEVALPSAPGLSLRGALARFDFDSWRDLYKALRDEDTADSVTLADINIDVGVLRALGRQFHEVKIAAQEASNVWRVNVNSREIEGHLTWDRTRTDAAVNGHMKGNFARAKLPEAEKPSDEESQEEEKHYTALTPDGTNPWPSVDFEVDHFFHKERDLGYFSIQAEPRGTDWHMKNVVLRNEDGAITASGWWRTALQAQRTEVNLKTRVDNAEKFLERFGVPKSVVTSDVQLEGTLSWADAPSDFDIGSLNGHLTLDVGKGRFTKLEPGIGRLFSVLSLQALPRRITLDFRDVFSEGFTFDSITGTTEIYGGILNSTDLLMNGVAAKVKLTGAVDLGKEMQNLTVYVQPSMSDTVSVGAAGASALLMANPVGAAAVGVGALLGQMILDNPIEKIFSYEYTVRGSWDDPVVEKKSGEAPQLSPDGEIPLGVSAPNGTQRKEETP